MSTIKRFALWAGVPIALVIFLIVSVLSIIADKVGDAVKASAIISGAMLGDTSDIAQVAVWLQDWTTTVVRGNACPVYLTLDIRGKAPDSVDLFEAIKQDAKDNRTAMSMLFAANLGSGWQADRAQDGQYGIYALQDPGNGVNAGVSMKAAMNPALATNWLLGRFMTAQSVIDPNLWRSDPVNAVLAVATAAIQPNIPYATARSQADIQAAYNASLAKLTELGFASDLATRQIPPTQRRLPLPASAKPPHQRTCGRYSCQQGKSTKFHQPQWPRFILPSRTALRHTIGTTTPART